AATAVVVGASPRPAAATMPPPSNPHRPAFPTTESLGRGEFCLAGQLAREGNIGGALDNYQTLALDPNLPDELQDLALLYAIMLRMDGDTPAEDLIAELEPLTNPAITWRWSALELQALLHIENGDVETGRAMIADLLLEPNLPVSMRRRLFQWTEIYGVPEDPEQS
ncbi:MAG: hypothetical protein AAF213_13090, partial [Pseudomonadota bacterium]